MKNIFELTRSEQRVVIFIVVILVAVAFTQHFLESRSRPLPASPRDESVRPADKSTSSPTASPTIRPEEEADADDSR
jgi:hypothetical protein